SLSSLPSLPRFLFISNSPSASAISTLSLHDALPIYGELRQEGSTADMLTDIASLIEYITEFMTLQEDDVLLTGTPKGISHVNAGDVIRCEIVGLGLLLYEDVAEVIMAWVMRRATRSHW